MKDLPERQVELHCPVCGDTTFSFEEDDVSNDDCIFTCVRCGNEVTKTALIDQNDEVISAEVESMGDEAVAALTKELNSSLKGLKGLKIKF